MLTLSFRCKSNQTPLRASDAVRHGTEPKSHQVVEKGHTLRSKLDTVKVPMEKQIEDYAAKEEERYNQIATHQENTHTFAKLASKLGGWEKSIDGEEH